MNKIGAKQNLSTAFHPQTDGLSEQKNQWVEQYLRLIANAQQEDWSQWLTVATAVHNDHVNSMLGMTPSEVLLGYRLVLTPDQKTFTNNQMAEQRLEILHQKHAQAIAVINKVANQSSTPEGKFQEGDQVWLEATNLKLPYHTPKLAPRRQGPFHINKVISPVAYQLALPLSWGIHNIFHASLLLPYKESATHGPNYTQPPPDLIEDEEEYEVEAIINHRLYGCRRQLQYLIKWKGYPSSDNTWEAAEDVHADDLRKEYHKHHPLEIAKRKTTRGAQSLVHALQSLAFAPSPTQRVATWLRHSITTSTQHCPLTQQQQSSSQTTSCLPNFPHIRATSCREREQRQQSPHILSPLPLPELSTPRFPTLVWKTLQSSPETSPDFYACERSSDNDDVLRRIVGFKVGSASCVSKSEDSRSPWKTLQHALMPLSQRQLTLSHPVLLLNASTPTNLSRPPLRSKSHLSSGRGRPL